MSQALAYNVHVQSPARPGLAARWWHVAALGAVLLLAVGLHFYALDQVGYGNLYYAATVRSMLTSWKNFFYGSFDPGGFVTVDKPPLGLWVQAASALVFGFNGWALMFPQALAGVLSVALTFHLVRRTFGPAAGVLAALVLTLTPISIAANRNNSMDSQLVFTSLLAAWAIMLAVERGQLRWLLAGAVLVGIGFNIKMLQAVMVLPAFYLVYLFAPIKWWKRILHLLVTTVVLLVVSLSWAGIVDLTPADERPYIGSSHNNTVMELIVGHNGAARLGQLTQLLGLTPTGPGANRPQGNPPQSQPGQPPQGNPPQTQFGNQTSSQAGQPPAGVPPQQFGDQSGPQAGQPPSGFPPQSGSQSGPQAGQPASGLPPQSGNQSSPQQGGNPPQPPVNGQPGSQLAQGNPPQAGGPGQPPDGPQGGPLQNETGAAGIFRLFNQQLAGQISWLLPLALLCIVVLAWQVRLSWPLAKEHLVVIMWAAWLIPMAVFFSFAGLFHRYYLEMMAPAIAALVGAGVVALWSDYRQHRWRGWLLPIALVASAAGESIILSAFSDWAGWLTPVVIGLTLLAATGLAVLKLARDEWGRAWAAPFATMGMVGLLIAPAVWAATPITLGGDAGLPFAGPELQGRGGGGRRANQVPSSSALVDYLTSNRDGATYLAATLNANTAAPIILATGEPVMAMGGFSGSDQILSTDELAALVQEGVVRFFLVPQENSRPGGGPGPNQQPAPIQGNREQLLWVTTNCSMVDPALWRDAGTQASGGPGGPAQLYDCGLRHSG